MKQKIILIATAFLGLLLFVTLSFRYVETKTLLKKEQTIDMPGVNGRIDHMQYDVAGQKLFVCALGNSSVEIADTKQNKITGEIKNLQSPQGIVFIPELKKIFVACGGDGYVHVFNSENYRRLDSVYVGNDADNVRYDSISKRIYVGSDNGMTIINLSDLKIFKTIELEGHPESFQIDYLQRKMFVNVPDANEIEVINLKNNVVTERWSLMDSKENFPMVVDENAHRVFVACRHPSKIVVMDSQTGSLLSAVGCAGDADDLFYDQVSKQLIVSCGEGYVDVFNEKADNIFSQADHVNSRIMARTSFYVPSEKKFFLAVPAGLIEGAEIRTYTLLQ
jgi:DNA-binding beta-propeller fold protein YncE